MIDKDKLIIFYYENHTVIWVIIIIIMIYVLMYVIATTPTQSYDCDPLYRNAEGCMYIPE